MFFKLPLACGTDCSELRAAEPAAAAQPTRWHVTRHAPVRRFSACDKAPGQAEETEGMFRLHELLENLEN